MKWRGLIPWVVIGIGSYYFLKPRHNQDAPKVAVQSTFMQFGSQGTDVLNLQLALSYLGYIVGPLDGIYGEETQNAVRNFQRDEGLIPDGIAGEQTYSALDARLRQYGGSFTFVGR
jgi:peptidoglycan hydrolase-like protein with peptidoglycan-binding domain